MGVKKNAFLRRWTRLRRRGISHAATAADGAVAHAVDGDAERVAQNADVYDVRAVHSWRTTEDVEAEGATALRRRTSRASSRCPIIDFYTPRRKI